MKSIICILFILISTIVTSQCSNYYIYESFSASLPTQQGTWVNTSVLYGTTAGTCRTGTHYLTFNALNDAFRTPMVAAPKVFSCWYRRSTTSTGTPKFLIQTSPDNTNWTTQLTISTFTTTWTQATVDLAALGLTNIYIRILDQRASGTAERYIEDLSITATSNTQLIPYLAACSQTIDGITTYTITDDASLGVSGYSNNMDRTQTFTPSSTMYRVTTSFTEVSLETDYDYVYVYDGVDASAPLLATITGTAVPSIITATNSSGALTIRWTTDVSNVGTWSGFAATMGLTPVPLPVNLLYFEGVSYPTFNMLKWATASEHNSAYYAVEQSKYGSDWKLVGTKSAAGYSNQNINYSILDAVAEPTFHYYRLIQYDTDGNYEIFGPIILDNTVKVKRVIKIINMTGQEVGAEARGVLIEIYEDGSTKKILR